MSAVFDEQILAGVHLRVHIVTLDGASRPLQHALPRVCQDKSRPVHALLDPAGNDPGQRFMTISQKNDKDTPVLHFFAFDQCSSRVSSFGGHALSAVIEILELLRVFERAARILLHEQFQPPVCRVQPSCRIETGTDHKSRVVAGQRSLRKTGHTDQGLQSRVI